MQNTLELVDDIDDLDAADVSDAFNGDEFVDNAAAASASSAEYIFASVVVELGVVGEVFDFHDKFLLIK